MMKTGLSNINKPAFLGNNVSFTQKLPYSWAFVTEEMPKGGYGFVIKKSRLKSFQFNNHSKTMKTKGTFPGSFSVVDYKITSEYKMKLLEQPICTLSKWRSYFIWQPYPMVGKPSQNPEHFIQQADTIGNSTITLTSK